jgi:hypothetical protein
MTRPWTDVGDVVAVLRRRWATGRYLTAHAGDEPWMPVSLPVKGPTAAETLDALDDVRRWAQRFQHDSHTAGGQARLRIEQRRVSGRGLGANQLPVRVHIDTFEQLCALLGTAGEVRACDELLARTADERPELVGWARAHPLVVLEHREQWSRLLATVGWIAEHDCSGLYLRHIDVAGVDTKFVERHQQLLGQLLTAVLPAERLHRHERDFARRFGFQAKPGHTRLRLLVPVPGIPAGLTELSVRTDELADLDLPVSTVFVVENETSYLAFPTAPDAVVIWGRGFANTTLEGLPWLPARQVVYWGDIDTHGFAILNRLRQRLPAVVSILMDHDTLLAHPTQYVTEPTPTNAPQPHLTEVEQALYRDLVEDRFGPNIRLEQERIRFSCVERALTPWT